MVYASLNVTRPHKGFSQSGQTKIRVHPLWVTTSSTERLMLKCLKCPKLYKRGTPTDSCCCSNNVVGKGIVSVRFGAA